jgi:photosystem II stability/assembly factor-like uncharacterized protein
MGPRRVYSVAVDPRDGQRLWLTVSSAVGPTGGGVYESRDGGFNWINISEGLPSRALFRDAIWHVGGQIAASPDGSLVCFSHDSGGVFARAADAGAWQQTMDDAIKPVDVSADPHTPGRYLLTDGVALHESRDGGRTWTRITQVTDIFRISFDQAVPGRVALGGKQHILASSDGGATFTAITDKLPFPVDNVLAFAGDRVVVGTPGCGAYWSPLTAQGAQPVQARPESLQASAPAPAKEGAINVLPPMREEKPGEPGWALRWSGEGKPQVSIEATDANGAKLPTMVVIAQEPSTGSAGAMIPRGHRRVRISGEILVAGEFTQAQVAVQSFGPGGKQIGWTTLTEAKSVTQWTRFEQVLDLPADYITSSVRVCLKARAESRCAMPRP